MWWFCRFRNIRENINGIFFRSAICVLISKIHFDSLCARWAKVVSFAPDSCAGLYLDLIGPRFLSLALYSPWETSLCALILFPFMLSSYRGPKIMCISVMVVFMVSWRSVSLWVMWSRVGIWFPILTGRLDLSLR